MSHRERPEGDDRAAGAIYGTIVYLTILVLFAEDRTDPGHAATILIATGVVFWLAHVYAHIVPKVASEGRFRWAALTETAREQIGILASVAIPIVPLVLAMLDVVDDQAGLRAAIVAGILSLGAFAIQRARAAGLGWRRSIWIATVLPVAGIGLLWLEVALH